MLFLHLIHLRSHFSAIASLLVLSIRIQLRYLSVLTTFMLMNHYDVLSVLT
jgi:hypothetical protein